MAVTLPTLTVTDLQGTRILDAYKARFGTTTQAETVKAFRQWLAAEVRSVVMANEAAVMDEQNNASKRSALALVEASLPDPSAVA